MATNDKNKGLAILSIMSNPDLKDTLQSGLSAPLGSSKRDKAKSVLFNTGRASGVIDDNFIDPLSAQMAGMTLDPNTGQMIPIPGKPDPKQPSSQSFIGPGGQQFTPDAGLQQDSSSLSTQGQQFTPGGPPKQDLSKLTVQEGGTGDTSKILFIPEAPPQKTNSIVDEMFNKLDLTGNINAPWITAMDKAVLESYKGIEDQMPSFIVDRLLDKKKNWETAHNLVDDKKFQLYWDNLPNTQNFTTKDKQDFYLQWKDLGSPSVGKVAPLVSSKFVTDTKTGYTQDFENYWKGITSTVQGQKLTEQDKQLHYDRYKKEGGIPEKQVQPGLPDVTGEAPDLTPEEKSEFLESYETDPATAYIQMIMGSASKTAFANQFASDQAKLSGINPDMPKEGIDSISGSSLTGQVDNLGEAKDMESEMDKQLDFLLDITNKVNLQIDKNGYFDPVSRAEMESSTQGTLDSYVRGRDTYLKKIDSMIEDTKDQMLDMDMTNPTTGRRMNSYLNYLTTLKGRQNQRYVNYVDSAVKQHQSAVNAGIARYNILKQQYNEDKEMTQAQYETNLKIGEEMWETVKNVEKDGLNMTILQSKAQKAVADSAMSVLKLQDYGKTTGTYLDNKTYYDNKLKLGLEKSTLGTKGIKMFNGNLNGVLSSIQNEGKDPKGFITALNKQIKDNAFTAIGGNKNQGLDRYFDNYKDVISEFYNTYKFAEIGDNLTQEEKDEIIKITTPIAQGLKETLFENVAHELKKYATTKDSFGSTPSFSNNVKAAIQGLVGQSGWPKKKVKSAIDINDEAKTEEWRANNKSVPSAILDGIYDAVTVANIVENHADPMTIFTSGYESLDKTPIEALIDIIVNKGLESNFILN